MTKNPEHFEELSDLIARIESYDFFIKQDSMLFENKIE